MKNPILLVGIIIVIFLAVFVVINLGNMNQNDSNNLTWYDDVNYALQQAQMNNKTVILDFYSPSCDNCRMLDLITFKDPHVIEKLKEKYVLVKIKLEENPDLVNQYQIITTPTLVFLDANGKEIKRITDYIKPEDLINKL
ncbi:MAG: thioredoxin family protein [Methanobacterium sp.]|nr:thioredoxin family protein [Methanobacterium sp.]